MNHKNCMVLNCETIYNVVPWNYVINYRILKILTSKIFLMTAESIQNGQCKMQNAEMEVKIWKESDQHGRVSNYVFYFPN